MPSITKDFSCFSKEVKRVKDILEFSFWFNYLSAIVKQNWLHPLVVK